MAVMAGMSDDTRQQLDPPFDGEWLREQLDYAVMKHTGRSIGDLASGRVAVDVLAALAPLIARLVAEAEQRGREQERASWGRDLPPEAKVVFEDNEPPARAALGDGDSQ